ncbi:MAG: hypothetical protein JWQ87_2034 [Candidatus Sulfotelmatobacter sp.]|nr:hypothetical protein [Candidatus Sulfotelmatobacter sp.]
MRRRGKIIGYFVHATEGIFHEADRRKDVPEVKGTTLWFGRGATLFPTRRVAKAAIARTKNFRQIYFTNPEKYWPWIDRAWISEVRAAL